MTEVDLEKLNAQVQEERRAKEQQRDGIAKPPGTIEEWLEKKAKRLCSAQTNSSIAIFFGLPTNPKGETVIYLRLLLDPWHSQVWKAKLTSVKQDLDPSADPEEESVFQYPPGWPPVHELPPSLQAPPPSGWLIPPNLQWG
ncbi:zinc finger matrin-type protein 5 isoform X3 [Sphaerodactylus townsendi]|nr:zinc finger matrin-type protein 5 isoform X3 [Sphaerodactylus townsendi]